MDTVVTVVLIVLAVIISLIVGIFLYKKNKNKNTYQPVGLESLPSFTVESGQKVRSSYGPLGFPMYKPPRFVPGPDLPSIPGSKGDTPPEQNAPAPSLQNELPPDIGESYTPSASVVTYQ